LEGERKGVGGFEANTRESYFGGFDDNLTNF
jgi:hypothetical protein